MKGISPWSLAAKAALSDQKLSHLLENKLGNYQFKVQLYNDSLWIRCILANQVIAFRAAYSPDGMFQLKNKRTIKDGISINLSSTMGDINVKICLTNREYPILRYTTTLTPTQDLHIPFWPRDIAFTTLNSNLPIGEVYVKQVGTRSGLLHFSIKNPELGSVLYLQNLTTLADYNEQTETSAGETVGGLWPEIGFALPPTKDKPLQKKTAVVISDAIIAFDENITKNEADLSKQYLNMLAAVYLELPKPNTNYTDWPTILDKGLHDLIDSPGCWSQVEGKHYFNAYISDYETPPEIMVQLAVLLPLNDYVAWGGKKLDAMDQIRDGLSAFYDEKLKTIMRWLPAAA
ncbi:MAG: hypothetical protein EOO91_19530, partial [Pedobacter sp.]